MADDKKVQRPKRVFVNNLDTYSSKYVAKFLSTCVVGGSLEEVEEEEDEEDKPQDEPTLQDGTFQIVGTVAVNDASKSTFALEQYTSTNRDELLLRLLECDIVVYNIAENATPELIEEANWAITALHAEIDRFSSQKMFVLVSSVMTWSMSKPVDPDDPDIPLTEEDYRRKRHHPNFKEHANTEKLVLKLGKTKKSKLSSYVVAAGLQYGMGENLFHFFFKASWLGEFERVPVYGPGTNVIPTIHVNDLAGVIQNVIDHKPKTHYFIAVDDSKNTLEDIIKAISLMLGSGKIKKVPREEAYLYKALLPSDLNYLSIHLRIEPVFLKDTFNLHWVSETGIVDNIKRVVEEYKHTRQLLPIRICLLGPPAVGKSTVAEKLCKHYKLHHIKLRETIDEKIALLEEAVKRGEQEPEAEESGGSAQVLLDRLKDNIYQNEGQLDDKLAHHILREKLNSKPCRNQGFVLDAYPKTYSQAKELFYDEDMELGSPRSKMPMYDKKIIPEFIFCLEASDDFLMERVRNLPENMAENTRYTQDEFPRRLAKYRQANVEDETVVNYFDELEIHPEHIEVNDAEDLEYTAVTEKITKMAGRPRNYGPTPQERAELERRAAEEEQQRTALEAAERRRREAAMAAKMAAHLEEWNRQVTEVKRQEQELLEVRSLPLRNYLMKFAMPTLTEAMIECGKAKPEDPVDFLAEYLLRNTSQD